MRNNFWFRHGGSAAIATAVAAAFLTTATLTALSDAARSDATLPDAAARCDAPPPLPGHSPCPRPPVRGHHRPYGHRLL